MQENDFIAIGIRFCGKKYDLCAGYICNNLFIAGDNDNNFVFNKSFLYFYY